MFVTVFGKKIEVAVSDGGTFHDVDTKTISAKTLKGLEKKLREANIPRGNVPVEHTTGKQGVATGSITNHRWNIKYNVKWNDGTISQEYGYSLTIPRTEEQRQKQEQLKAASDAAGTAAHRANSDLSEFERQFNISNVLAAAFPRH